MRCRLFEAAVRLSREQRHYTAERLHGFLAPLEFKPRTRIRSTAEAIVQLEDGMRCQLIAAMAVVAAATGFAQAPKKLAFEVASVRLSEGVAPPSRTVTETRVTLLNLPMPDVLTMAFGVERARLVFPEWVRAQRVDIQATVPTGATREQIPDMLQTLLAERFSLVVRRESRPTDLYELIVGTGGVKVREVEPLNELETPFTDASGKAFAFDRVSPDGKRLILMGLTRRQITARTRFDTQSTERGTQRIDAARMAMSELVEVLRSNLGKDVLDKTGLTGVYQFTIELPPGAMAEAAARRAAGTLNVNGEPITPNTDPSGLSVFKAVEGLGLRLVERRSPAEFLVIDKIERAPTEN